MNSVAMNIFGQTFFGGGGGGMMMPGGGFNPLQALFGGVPPPSGKSQCGKYWDEYFFDALSQRFPHSYHEITSRSANGLWTGRKILVVAKPGAAPTSGTIKSLKQFNTTPFSPYTQWSLEVQYDNKSVRNFLLGDRYKSKRKKQPTTVRHVIHRAHPERGGTFHRDSIDAEEEQEEEREERPLISFTFVDPPTPSVFLSDGPPCPICRRPNTPSAFPCAPHIHDISEMKGMSVDTKRNRTLSVARERLHSFCNLHNDQSGTAFSFSSSSSSSSSSSPSSSSSSSSSSSPASSSSSSSSSSPASVSHFKGDCPVCMDQDIRCIRLDCGHTICYGCWSEWCSQQDDDSDRSNGAEDAEHASAENMHIEAAENIEVDADSLAANRAASRILLEETVSILLIFFFKF